VNDKRGFPKRSIALTGERTTRGSRTALKSRRAADFSPFSIHCFPVVTTNDYQSCTKTQVANWGANSGPTPVDGDHAGGRRPHWERPEACMTIGPAIVRPSSIGSVRLESADHTDPVILDANYLATYIDRTATVRGIELARDLGRQRASSDMRVEELIAGPKASCGHRRVCAPQHHQLGRRKGACKSPSTTWPSSIRSCAFAASREGVWLTPPMPRVPTGPTNAPSFMDGGMAARLILT
jgi:hypothetical protein